MLNNIEDCIFIQIQRWYYNRIKFKSGNGGVLNKERNSDIQYSTLLCGSYQIGEKLKTTDSIRK